MSVFGIRLSELNSLSLSLCAILAYADQLVSLPHSISHKYPMANAAVTPQKRAKSTAVVCSVYGQQRAEN